MYISLYEQIFNRLKKITYLLLCIHYYYYLHFIQDIECEVNNYKLESVKIYKAA